VRKGREKSAPSHVIASRVLNEIGGCLRQIVVLFEEPRRDPRGHWRCRFLIKGLARPQIRSAGGADSLQALLLAVEGARVTLDKTGSRFTWLETDPDKAGPGIPRYIPTHQGPRFEARVNLAIERESKRYFQSILKIRKANIAAFEAEVKGRRETLALLEETLLKRKAGAAEWQANLKEWKPEKTAGRQHRGRPPAVR
jgi:hypothetical protein